MGPIMRCRRTLLMPVLLSFVLTLLTNSLFAHSLDAAVTVTTSSESTPHPHVLPSSSPPSIDASSLIARRFLVGFHSYAPARDHEDMFRQLWASYLHPMPHASPFAPHEKDACVANQQGRNSSRQCSLYDEQGSQHVPFSWRVVSRNNPAATLPTDFLLVEFQPQDKPNPTEDRILSSLRSLQALHPSTLKYVMEDRQMQRGLLNFVEGEEEATEEEDNINSEEPHIPRAGGPGDFSPPQRFDMSRTLLHDEARQETVAATSPAGRKLHQFHGNSPTDAQKASRVWDKGYKGAGIKIAIFDTGLSATHPHFSKIEERTNWTDEPTLEDGLGHGTFVAGVIASGRDCLGFAPAATLHIFRVFNQRQLSFTSWFLDAFNYAIHSKVNILNLSIGGPDFLDRPFVEKVNEMSANGITVVSAIGNDGPLWGTLNNPADQMDVIGVGGVNEDDAISAFSSRGMTTWELPSGYGRMKPDVVTLARNIRGSNQQNGCKTMSGTSVASPVVAGCVTLLASVIPENERPHKLNPAFLKQLIVESTTRIQAKGNREPPGIFEQGEGKVSLQLAFDLLTDPNKPYETHASIIPSKLDLTDCPYMWPYCTQPLYHTAIPIIVNMTILNSQGVASFIPPDALPKFHAADELTRQSLHVSFSHAESFWPWSGFFALHLSLKQDVTSNVNLMGYVEITLQTDDEFAIRSVIKLPLKVLAIPTPERSKRLLFDIFHNLRYPSGYFPRDNLEIKTDTLDWNGDHIHTNYRELYTVLRTAGYFIEVLGKDYTCYNASHYSTLMLIDPEEEYFVEEVAKMQDDVYLEGMNVLLLADWYNTQIMREIKFYDENTAAWWTPETGGANIPALNALMKGFGIEFTDHAVKGDVNIGGELFYYASGTSLARFPASGYILSHQLMDAGSGARTKEYPIVGAYAPAGKGSPLATQFPNAGRVFVYGDSNCIDMNHRRGNLCANLILHALSYLNTGDTSRIFRGKHDNALTSPFVESPLPTKPRRAIGNNLIKYSKVISPSSAPSCPVMGVETKQQHEEGLKENLYEVLHAELQEQSLQQAPAANRAAGGSDEAKASARFHSSLQKIQESQKKHRNKKRRKHPMVSTIEDDPVVDSILTMDSTSASGAKGGNASPVLAKQARLNATISADEPLENAQVETAELFAVTSNADAYAQKMQREALKEIRQLWMSLTLGCLILGILVVGYFFRRALHLQSLGKHSPASTPAPSPRLVPRATAL